MGGIVIGPLDLENVQFPDVPNSIRTFGPMSRFSHGLI